MMTKIDNGLVIQDCQTWDKIDGSNIWTRVILGS